jgi:hypothetical protein
MSVGESATGCRLALPLGEEEEDEEEEDKDDNEEGDLRWIISHGTAWLPLAPLAYKATLFVGS